MERREDEKYITFLKRVVNAKEDNKITYNEMGDLLVGKENNRWSSENWRKSFYTLKAIIENIEDDTQLTQEEVIAELEKEKVEIYKERIKLRDQRRELNKLHTAEARFENLREIMEERLEEIGTLPYVKVEPFESENKGATLLISDLHYGITVDNQFNYFDCEVCNERLDLLISKTIEKCKLHKINKLNVEILGDLVSGTIQTGCRVQQEEDIMTQIMDISEKLSNCIETLANEIPNVTVYTVFGNHGRALPDKKQSINCENYERLVYYYMKKRVKGVKFIDAMTADFIKYNDYGKTFVISHGDKDKKDNAIASYSKLLNDNIGEVHLAHFHSFEENIDKGYIINGSVMGSDEYAISIRKNTRPLQVLKIYGDDEITYKLYLD